MGLVNIIGWIGNIGFMIGVVYIARKNIYGFHLNIFGNILYGIQACMHKPFNHPLLLLSIYLVVINIYGICHWRQANKKLEAEYKMEEKDQHILLQVKSLLNYILYFVKDEDRHIFDDFHSVCRKYCSWGKKNET